MIWLNGRLVAREQAHIDPADRGLLLADGLFETLRAYRGHVFKLEEHLQRMAQGAAELGIPLPLDPPSIAHAVRETLDANQLSAADAAIRITLTRGPGQRGLLPPEDPLPDAHRVGRSVSGAAQRGRLHRDHREAGAPQREIPDRADQDAVLPRQRHRAGRGRSGGRRRGHHAQQPGRHRLRRPQQPVRGDRRRLADACARGWRAARHHAPCRAGAVQRRRHLGCRGCDRAPRTTGGERDVRHQLAGGDHAGAPVRRRRAGDRSRSPSASRRPTRS